VLHTGTKNELVQTKIDLEKKIANLRETSVKAADDLTVKLNGISLLHVETFK
jgi:hypothetical protein